MLKGNYLYHITNVNNIDSIIEEGLRANEEGYIYLFDDVSYQFLYIRNTIADHIAHNQLMLEEYAMFKIPKDAIMVEIEHDNIAELTHEKQYRVKQNLIAKENVHFAGWYWTTFNKHTGKSSRRSVHA